MTMLDRMRRHKYWLKWSLALVVLAFIALYIPSRNRNLGGAAPHDELATVNGEPVTVSAYRRAYQQQVQMYRSAYGPNFNEQMLKQMGIEQQILRQLLDERAAVVEARRLGLSVSDAEVAQRILAIPAFQQNGVFAGEDVYAQVLASQRPPLTKSEFEDSLRRSLLVDKLHASLTDWMTVTDADVTAEFKRRNEKAKVELVVLSADRLRGDVTVTDADLSTWFDAHKEDYRVGEKKKVKYLLVDVDKLRAAAVVPPGDIEKFYRDNQQEFTTPEQVRASHILIKSDKDDAAAKAKAEALLKQVKSGADFAALAKKNSEDEGSAKNGGDLDYFGRGRMVKEFEDAAFSLQPGQMSDVVKIAVRLPHHQGRRPQAGDHEVDRGCPAADRGSPGHGAGAGRREHAGHAGGRRAQDAGRPRPRRGGAQADRAGVRVLPARRAGGGPRSGAGDYRSGVHGEGGHDLGSRDDGSGHRVLRGGRHRALATAAARRGEGQGERRRDAAEGARADEDEGGRAGGVALGRGLREGREGRRPRGEDERARGARHGVAGRGHQPGARPGDLRAARPVASRRR